MRQIKQGDSLWINYTLTDYADINSTWDSNWTGIFEISASESSTPVYTGTLTRATAGLFQLRLSSNSASTAPVLNWVDIPVGNYKLFAQFTNATVQYREEHHEKLSIQEQGLS